MEERQKIPGTVLDILRKGSEEIRKNHAETCLISGGETTVTVKGHGLGGRNMELALSFPIEIEGNFPGMIRAAAIGSKGWNKVITEIIA